MLSGEQTESWKGRVIVRIQSPLQARTAGESTLRCRYYTALPPQPTQRRRTAAKACNNHNSAHAKRRTETITSVHSLVQLTMCTPLCF